MTHSTKKKTYFAAIASVILLAIPFFVFGQGYQLLAPFDSNIPSQPSLAVYLVALFRLILGVAVILAVIMIVIGGIQYMGSESIFSKEESKKRIGGAILGLLLAFLSYVILNAINPGLLNLGFNLQNLQLEGGGPPATATTPVTSKCSSGQWSFFYDDPASPTRQESSCYGDEAGCIAGQTSLINAFSGVTNVSSCQQIPNTTTSLNCQDPGALLPALNSGGTVCGSSQYACGGTSPAAQYANIINNAITNTPGASAVLTQNLIGGLIMKESSGNPNPPPGPAGACGLMQILPSEVGQSGCTGPVNLLDPYENISRGVAILMKKYNSISNPYGNRVTRIEMALAAYNCCANGQNPNSPSVDCSPSTGWPSIPKWACPINPGDPNSPANNMCGVSSYSCSYF